MGYFLIPPPKAVDALQILKLAAMLKFTAQFPDEGIVHVTVHNSKQTVVVTKNGETMTYAFEELLNE